MGVPNALLCLANNTAIASTFTTMKERFDKLYKRRCGGWGGGGMCRVWWGVVEWGGVGWGGVGWGGVGWGEVVLCCVGWGGVAWGGWGGVRWKRPAHLSGWGCVGRGGVGCVVMVAGQGNFFSGGVDFVGQVCMPASVTCVWHVTFGV